MAVARNRDSEARTPNIVQTMLDGLRWVVAAQTPNIVQTMLDPCGLSAPLLAPTPALPEKDVERGERCALLRGICRALPAPEVVDWGRGPSASTCRYLWRVELMAPSSQPWLAAVACCGACCCGACLRWLAAAAALPRLVA